MQFGATGWTPCKNVRKAFTRMTVPAILPRHQLACWQASISVSWAVGGVCKVFACLLGSYLASLGTALLIAALRNT